MSYFTVKPEDQADTILIAGKHIINSHSKGSTWSRKYSPLVATLASGQTLEYIYQSLKVDARGAPLPFKAGKDDLNTYTGFKTRAGFLPNVERNEIFHLLYYTLFAEQPLLINEAMTCDGARDFFDGQGGIPFLWATTPLSVEPGTRCNQARSIAWCILKRELHPIMQECFNQYWARYH